MSSDVSNFYFPSLDNNSKSYQTKGQGDEEIRVRNICKVKSCDREVHGKYLCHPHLRRLRVRGDLQESIPIFETRQDGRRNIDIPGYTSWANMLDRCNNSKRKNYKYYGAKGIKVCKRWLKFNNFISDMGEKPTSEHTIERKNSNRNYSPSNCVWATTKEQNRNLSNSVRPKELNRMRFLRKKGLTLPQISDLLGRHTSVISRNLNAKT